MHGDLAVELWRDWPFCWVVVVPADGKGVERHGSGTHNPGLPWDGHLFKRLMCTKWGARRKGAKMVAALRAGVQAEPADRILYPATVSSKAGPPPPVGPNPGKVRKDW